MKNVNFDFLLDIWADLKAKRLAPVAVGMGVALVAMPALLLKGEDSASTAPIPAVAPPVDSGPKVEVADELAHGTSKLDSYKARDPFKGIVKAQSDAGPSGTAIAPTDTPGDSGKTTGLGDVLGTSGSTDTGSTDTGSTGSSGSSTPSDLGGSSVTPPADTPPTVIVKRHHGYKYNYELDLKFGKPGREKHYAAVPRLTFLPSPKVPALLFMGVSPDEQSALFFVYPGLSHQGQGQCIPDAQHCNFVKLAIGKEHYFSANDLEFHIKLLDINRVRLHTERKKRKLAREAAARKLKGRRSGRATGDGDTTQGGDSTGGDDTPQIVMPWLVDGIG